MNEHEVNSGYRIAVPAEFEEVFTHFYFDENTTAEPISRTVLPSYQTIMVFNFGPPVSFLTTPGNQVSIPPVVVTGPVRQLVQYIMPPGSAMLIANFKDDAFFRFFGIALVCETAVHPDELINSNCFTMLWNELNRMPDNDARVKYLLDFCRPYLKERNNLMEQIAEFRNGHVSPIKELSGRNDLTERAVQLHHKKLLGYSAKEIARYQRFLKAVRMLQEITAAAPKVDWFEVIAECGYYDQSQLIHDFKHYLQLSPSKYLKLQQDICNPRP